jgi:hypothetical protein
MIATKLTGLEHIKLETTSMICTAAAKNKHKNILYILEVSSRNM